MTLAPEDLHSLVLEGDVPGLEGKGFGDPQAGLGHDPHDEPVSEAGKGTQGGAPEDRLDLLSGVNGTGKCS